MDQDLQINCLSLKESETDCKNLNNSNYLNICKQDSIFHSYKYSLNTNKVETKQANLFTFKELKTSSFNDDHQMLSEFEGDQNLSSSNKNSSKENSRIRLAKKRCTIEQSQKNNIFQSKDICCMNTYLKNSSSNSPYYDNCEKNYVNNFTKKSNCSFIINKKKGIWSKKEHLKFLNNLKKFDFSLTKIADHYDLNKETNKSSHLNLDFPKRTEAQLKAHCQRFVKKLCYYYSLKTSSKAPQNYLLKLIVPRGVSKKVQYITIDSDSEALKDLEQKSILKQNVSKNIMKYVLDLDFVKNVFSKLFFYIPGLNPSTKRNSYKYKCMNKSKKKKYLITKELEFSIHSNIPNLISQNEDNYLISKISTNSYFKDEQTTDFNYNCIHTKYNYKNSNTTESFNRSNVNKYENKINLNLKSTNNYNDNNNKFEKISNDKVNQNTNLIVSNCIYFTLEKINLDSIIISVLNKMDYCINSLNKINKLMNDYIKM